MEQLIQFPLPTYKKIFDTVEDLVTNPICLCYQYDIDDYHYGPYGFDTPLAERLLESLFKSVKFWDGNTLKSSINCALRKNVGLYFYSGFTELEQLALEVNSYKIMLKKNAYFSKKGKETLDLPTKPMLLDIFNDNGFYKSSTLNKLLDLGISFYVRECYYPQAGDSFIIFDKNKLTDKMKTLNNINGLKIYKINSIDELKPW